MRRIRSTTGDAPSAASIADRTRTAAGRARARAELLAGCRPARRSAGRRLAAVVVVVALTAWCAHSQRRAASLEDRWDATRQVIVARHDLSEGGPVTAADLTSQRRPSALVPSGALEDPGVGGFARTDIPAGEVIIGARIAERPERSSVPPGRAAVEVAVSLALPALRPGDRVDLLAVSASTDPFTATPGSADEPEEVDRPGAGALVVARDALVLDGAEGHESGSLTVAVRDADVTATAAASLAGPVAVVRRPPPG